MPMPRWPLWPSWRARIGRVRRSSQGPPTPAAGAVGRHESSIKRVETADGPDDDADDQEPRRAAQAFVEPEAEEHQDNERQRELQTSPGVFGTGGRCGRVARLRPTAGHVRPAHAASLADAPFGAGIYELVKFFASESPMGNRTPAEKSKRDPSHFHNDTSGVTD